MNECVNKCVHGSLRLTGVNSRVNSTTFVLSIARIGSRSFFFVDNLYKLAYCHLSIRKQWECKLLNSTLVMEEQCLNAEMHIRMITTGRQYLSTFSMECPVHHGQPECTILLGVNMVKPYGA